MSSGRLRQWLHSSDGHETLLFAVQAVVLWRVSVWPS
jgi:hypothetical protein